MESGLAAPRRRETVALAARAQKGDTKALAELREAFDALQMWENFMPAAVMGRVFAGMVADENLLVREATRRQAEALRRELAGPSPTPLEKLLVERIVVCWLASHYSDRTAMAKLAEGCSFGEGDFWRKAQDSANKRFLAACKALATVRKLALPVLQMNVAQQQVNVAGDVTTANPLALARSTPEDG